MGQTQGRWQEAVSAEAEGLEALEALEIGELYLMMAALYQNLFGERPIWMQAWGPDELIHWFLECYVFDGKQWCSSPKLIH